MRVSRSRRLLLAAGLLTIGVPASLSLPDLEAYGPIGLQVFPQNYFGANWGPSWMQGPSISELAIASSAVGFVAAFALENKTYLVSVFWLSVFGLIFAALSREDYLAFPCLLMIQATHLILLIAAASPKLIYGLRKNRGKPRISIRQILVVTFVAAVAVGLVRDSHQHVFAVMRLTPRLNHFSFNYWILVVGAAIAANTLTWQRLSQSPRNTPFKLMLHVGLAVMLGCVVGILFLSVNPSWDTSLHGAGLSVHIGYICCFLLQGLILWMTDLVGHGVEIG